MDTDMMICKLTRPAPHTAMRREGDEKETIGHREGKKMIRNIDCVR